MDWLHYPTTASWYHRGTYNYRQCARRFFLWRRQGDQTPYRMKSFHSDFQTFVVRYVQYRPSFLDQVLQLDLLLSAEWLRSGEWRLFHYFYETLGGVVAVIANCEVQWCKSTLETVKKKKLLSRRRGYKWKQWGLLPYQQRIYWR